MKRNILRCSGIRQKTGWVFSGRPLIKRDLAPLTGVSPGARHLIYFSSTFFTPVFSHPAPYINGMVEKTDQDILAGGGK
jgi:hypothetical protein